MMERKPQELDKVQAASNVIYLMNQMLQKGRVEYLKIEEMNLLLNSLLAHGKETIDFF